MVIEKLIFFFSNAQLTYMLKIFSDPIKFTTQLVVRHAKINMSLQPLSLCNNQNRIFSADPLQSTQNLGKVRRIDLQMGDLLILFHRQEARNV